MTVAGIYEIEAKRFLEYSLRWRNVPKPSIAAVQGVCIAGGLLLCWPCDLIIAADNAKFSDPVVSMGIGGVEYHGHTWEWGARKAKEMLFTGRAMTAQEAEAIGMVTRVVPLDELRSHTRALAAEIATRHPFALRQAKRAVNQTLDVQGFYAAIQSVFEIHQNGHGNALSESGLPILMQLDGDEGRDQQAVGNRRKPVMSSLIDPYDLIAPKQYGTKGVPHDTWTLLRNESGAGGERGRGRQEPFRRRVRPLHRRGRRNTAGPSALDGFRRVTFRRRPRASKGRRWPTR